MTPSIETDTVGTRSAAASRIGDAMDLDAGDRPQARDQASDELPLVLDDGGHAGNELAPALAGLAGARGAGHVAVRAPDVAQVVGRGQRAGDRLERRRAGLESIMGGADLERRQGIEDVGLAVQRAEVWPEPLVGAAHEEVGVERLDVDRAVWRVRDGVDVGQRPDLVGPGDDLARPG